MMKHIEKAEVAARLDAAISYPAGIEGLNTLLYGWTRKNESLRIAIRHRSWLYEKEVEELSVYAGVDLTSTEANSVCE